MNWIRMLMAVTAVSLHPWGATPSIAADGPPALASMVVTSDNSSSANSYDGTVEAVHQTVLSAQVPGAVVSLLVKAGDRVKAGQVLLRLDARAAKLHAGAAAAQVQVARASLESATREFERQKLLHEKNYISQAALDRAEAQYKSARAEASALLAAAGAADAESDFYTVKAPYECIVADVLVVLGDLAMPGRPLLKVYDPSKLRITVAVPQTAAPASDARPLGELPGVLHDRIAPVRWQLLPALDPATHTVQLRLDLPAGTAAVPGMFARAWVPGGADIRRIVVPAVAVVRRAELTGVYVIDARGRPLLRQVRVGLSSGGQIEVLSGLAAGERVALDPQAAARVR